MRKQMKKCGPYFSLVAAILLFIMGGSAHGNPTCELRLPPGEATMIVDVNEYKACGTLTLPPIQSLLFANLSGLPSSGYDITNGVYNGFCADTRGTILDNPAFGNVVYTAKFYSSLDPALPPELTTVGSETIPWNKINYILNNYPNENWLNVQAAIWSLVASASCNLNSQAPGGSYFYCAPDRPLPYPFPYGPDNNGCANTVNIARVQIIVNDTNTNPNAATFVPGPGQRIAVVVDVTSCTDTQHPSYCSDPAYLPFQVLFIPQTCCSGSIGDFVWHDLNHNGIQDTNEPGIDGVTVNLKNSSGVVIASTTTAVNGTQHGYYQFTGLCAGDYTVTVDELTLPPGYTPTTSNADTNPAVDSNGSPASVNLPTDSSSDQTIDFGYYTPCTGSIGDFVWHDMNRNGFQDAGEPGIDGVTVTLKNSSGTQIATTTTGVGPVGQHGYYQFTNLCRGDHTVEVVTPSGFTPTTSNASGSTPGNDSNGSPATVSLAADDSSNQTIDFGFVTPCTGSIGDFVWHDMNRNGFQDAGEPGIDGVTVTLKNSSGTQIATTTTGVGPGGQHGYYQFTGLCAANYTVEAMTPSGFSPASDCSNDQATPNDSNCSPATVSIPKDDSSNQTIDFGFVTPCTGSIGDFVWHDMNRNGIQDAGEPGIDGVTVNLKNSAGATIGTTTTNVGPGGQHGYYQFTGLCRGDYTVEVVTPSGFTPTTSNASGSTPGNDSNGSPATVSLAADDSSNQTIDFGFVTPCTGSIGDFVWHDMNRNGIQDAGEPGIDGVTVNLKRAIDNTLIATTTAGPNGRYQFTGLCAGGYIVEVVTPAGFSPTFSKAPGSTTTNDSNGSPAPVTLPADNSSDQTIDFGFTEQPVTANCVVIKAIQGVPITPVTMIGSGGAGAPYTFSATGLPSGLTMSTSGTISGTPTASGTFNYTVTVKDKNGNTGTVNCSVTISSLASVSGKVLRDCDANGTGETGLAGVTVTLNDATGRVVATYITVADGAYQFKNLPAGTYTVVVGILSSEYKQTLDPDATKDSQTTVMLVAGQSIVGKDFAYTGIKPGISLTKTANKTTANCGETITYTFIVTDTGNTCFYGGVAVDDPMFGGQIFHQTPVSPGQSFTFTKAYVAKPTDPSPLVNTATATGHVPAGVGLTNVTATATARVAVNCGTAVTSTCVSITAVQGVPITPVTMIGSGGAGAPYTFSATGLPSGLTMSTSGTISGTPTASGTFNYTVTVKDKNGNTGTVNCSVTVNPPRPVTANCVVINAVQGVPITPVTMIGNGGAGAPYTFSAAGLPAGLTMSSTGTISGTPTASGTFNYTVTVKDKNDNTGTVNCSVIVAPPVVCVPTTFNLTGNSASTGPAGNIRTFTAPNGTQVKASAWSRNKSMGAWSTAWLGSYSHGLGVTDKSENGADPNHTVDNVGSELNYVLFEFSSPVIVNRVYLDYVKGDSDISVWIGTKTNPFTNHQTMSDSFLSSLGTFEENLTTSTAARWADINNGNVSGNILVIAALASDTTPEDYFKLAHIETSCVTGPVTPSASCVIINATLGVAITPVTMTGSGGVGGPYTFSATGLPSGLSMSTSGTISGTPTVSGTFNYNVAITDKAGNTGTVNCSVTVNPPPTVPVTRGDAATILFWQSENGQALINSLNGGPTSKDLGNWLATSFPYLYSGINNLTGKTNAQVAALFMKFFSVRVRKTDAQMLGAALACYVTNSSLAGNVAAKYGFNVSPTGTSDKAYYVGSNGSAIGLQNNMSYTVLALLRQANLMKQMLRFNANTFNIIFDGINNIGDIR